MQDYTAMLEKLAVMDYPSMIRIGNKYDGGYVIADCGGYDFFIGCGVGERGNDNIDFEKGFIKKYNVKGLLYDGTIKKTPEHIEDILFVRMNIDGANTPETTNLSFESEPYKNIFLKMDIEGFEWNWLTTLENPLAYKQMVIEFHNLMTEKQLLAINKVLETHNIVHAHGNNNGPKKYDIPETLEITFLRKDVPVNGFVKSLPRKEDSPNCKYKKDYILEYPFVRT